MSALDGLDWSAIREHYDEREQTHKRLVKLHSGKRLSTFVDLMVGISDPSGNYSAAEHGLGPKILSENIRVEERLWTLAKEFLEVRDAHEIPSMIRRAALRYLQVGVGSEASCMMNPEVCWVANVRTIWTHLVYKHDDNFELADLNLRLYRDAEESSEMAYQKWQIIHAELAGTITRISEEGARLAKRAGVRPGSVRYLWADAIANQLYANYYE